ncbi:MAG: hypothetical protein ACO1OD_09180 [Croceibacterium sp.]
MKRPNQIVALIASLLLTAPATAGTITLEQDDGIDYIAIEGEIDERDIAHFQRLAIGSETAVVILASPGGALSPALEIGKIIRLKGFTTYVPDDIACTSSCALIWLSGQPRLLSPSSRIGFHASYTLEGGRQLESGLGNALVGRYLTLLNLPEKAVMFATSASPSQIRWLDPSDSRAAGIDFEIIDLGGTDASPEGAGPASGSNPIVANSDFEWEKGVWGVYSNSEKDGCIAVAVFGEEAGVENESSILLLKERHETSATLGFANEKFRSVQQGQTYDLEITFLTGETLDNGWGERRFTGVQFESGQRGLFANLAWDELRADMRDEEFVGFFLDNELIDNFPLNGSSEAITQFDKCLARTGSGQLADPFARP